MTSVMCWIGVDSRGISSVNIAADSRISWASESWDQGRKVFAAVKEPHVFGYYGDIVFPALAIPTVIELLDRRVVELSATGQWQGPVSTLLRTLWRGYPVSQRQDFGIIHAVRFGAGMGADFRLAIHSYRASADGWKHDQIPMPSVSSALRILGSGAAPVRRARARWQSSGARDTSRAEFSAFCDALAAGSDLHSGGGPQLVSLYRVGGGRLLGTIFRGRRYIAGRELAGRENVEPIEWRNELFERCDGRTRRRLGEAASHAQP